MAISVDWTTSPWLITIPQSDTTLREGTIYEITVDELWQLLRDFSDGPEGSARPVTYTRIPATSSTPAITNINLNHYRAEFEDGMYSVEIINGNSNFREAEVKNMVSVGTNNTTGFSVVTTGSGVTQQDKDDIENQIFDRLVEGTFSFEQFIRLIAAEAAGKVIQAGGGTFEIRDVSDTKNRISGDLGANNGRDISAVDGS